MPLLYQKKTIHVHKQTVLTIFSSSKKTLRMKLAESPFCVSTSRNCTFGENHFLHSLGLL